MYRPRCKQYILIFVYITSAVAGQEFMTGFIDKKPIQIAVDSNDMFYVDYGEDILRFSFSIDAHIHWADAGENYGNCSSTNRVAPDGTVYGIITSSNRPEKSDTTYFRMNLASWRSGDYTCSNLFDWSHTSGAKGFSDFSLSSLRVSKKGSLFFVIEHSYTDPKGDWQTDLLHYFEGVRIEPERFRLLEMEHFPASPAGVTVSADLVFVKDGNGLPLQVDRGSRYSRSLVEDGLGEQHVFFHDPADRSFYHRFFRKDTGNVVDICVDAAESGMDNVAFAAGIRIWTIHYFYRGPFNKGLLVTVNDAVDESIEKQFVLDASKKRNSGWDLVGAQSSTGRVLFTYISDKNINKREFVLINRVEDMEAMGRNLAEYGHPGGAVHAEKEGIDLEKGEAEALASAHLKPRKVMDLYISGGMQYVFWRSMVGLPSESGVADPYEAKYKHSDAFMESVMCECRLGETVLGVEVVTKLTEESVDLGELEGVKDIVDWRAYVGWDKLFGNFDVQLALNQAKSTVFFEDGSGQAPPHEFDMDFTELRFAMLDYRRQHFGALVQIYDFYQPVYIYKAPADSTSYSFHSQAIGDIKATNIFGHYGYTTLDYLVKYETAVSQLYFDGEVIGGISLAEYTDEVATTGKTPKIEYQFGFGGNIEAGWIAYGRLESLGGFGGAFKIGYRVSYVHIGSADKPEPLSESLSHDTYYFAYERDEFRHGPII